MRDSYTVTIRPRVVLRVLGVVLALMLIVAAGGYAARRPILRWMGEQLVHADPLVPADAIVVLAGGTPLRELQAADLYRAGYAPEIVLTVEPESPTPAILKERGIIVETDLEERLRSLQAFGVTMDHVTVLAREPVVSTQHEARLVLEWAVQRGATELIVVTSRFHTARARYAFQRAFQGQPVSIRFHPVSFDEFSPEDWWQHRGTLRTGIFEWQKLLLYRLRY